MWGRNYIQCQRGEERRREGVAGEERGKGEEGGKEGKGEKGHMRVKYRMRDNYSRETMRTTVIQDPGGGSPPEVM